MRKSRTGLEPRANRNSLVLGCRSSYGGKGVLKAVQNITEPIAALFRRLEGYAETAEVYRPRLLRSDQPIVVVVVDTPDA